VRGWVGVKPTGKERDVETGLDYFGEGVFTSRRLSANTVRLQICSCVLWGNGYENCELSGTLRKLLPTNVASTGPLWERLSTARAI
jgi:hypothetical protein